jgi:hypothetical protein
VSTHIFGIRHKETKEFLVFNSKCAWTKRGNAKNAWANAMSVRNKKNLFDEQDEYEIVDLTEIVYMYEDLCK